MDFDKMLKDIDARFLTVQQDVTAMEARVAEGRAEMMRLQGEYRLIVKLRDEEKAKEAPKEPEKK
jgi:hypothetical protein